MKPDSRSMYTVPVTTSPAGEPAVQAGSPTTAPKCCRWCGQPLLKPRRNQECCSAHCRGEWERSKRARRNQAADEKPKGTCLWCDGAFVRVRKEQDFCCPDHQQAFNNFWKGKGPVLAKALHSWRVNKAPGGLTKVCQEFSAAREDLKEKRAKARKR